MGNMREMENVHKILQKILKGRQKFRFKNNIKTDRVAVGCKTSQITVSVKETCENRNGIASCVR